jgi:hypothetical protein
MYGVRVKLALVTAFAIAFAVPALLPAAAAAHSGTVQPVATNFLAKIRSVPAGLAAKVVDGDQRLWLRVPRTTTVLVLDYRGVPYLRFTPAGVQVNHNSAMYYLNQTPVAETPPRSLTRSTPPAWVSVTSGHDYTWHDGRLHALATVALAPGTSFVGHWSIPLRVDGHPAAVGGGVWHAGRPSLVWFWPIAVLMLCVIAAVRLRRAELDARLARALATTALLALATAGIGRELHGHPAVSGIQYAELAIILAFVAWGLFRLWLQRPGYFTYFVIALAVLWEGLGLVSVLRDGFVLIDLPAVLARIVTVLLLACGASLLLLAFRLAELPQPRRRAAAAVATLLLAGCGATAHPAPEPGIPAALLREARPIGVGARFQPPASGPVAGRCLPDLGPRSGVHVELFAANRVVIVPAAIGTRAPRASTAGRISRARCYGDVVTLEPTGIVLVRPGHHLTLADVFRSWGEPLSSRRLASFRTAGAGRVAVYVGGRRWRGGPGAVPLTRHSEIVLEVGPHVPPHTFFTFPPGT